MQQGKRIEEYARESRSKASSALEAENPVPKTNVSAITQSLMSAIHKKNFAGYFKNNAYLRQLKTIDKKPLKIEDHTSHCAPLLQKLLTGEGLDVSEMGAI